MEGSRRKGIKETPSSQPPAASKLTFKRNRRRPEPWPRVGDETRARLAARAITDACGRALRRALPGAAALAVLAAIGGSAYAGYRFVTTSSRFAIETIAIIGTRQLSADQLRAVLPVQPGDNIFAADVDELVRALRTEPWIADAHAHRVLPHTLEVAIEERAVAGVAELGGLYLVDTNGQPFKRADIVE